MYLRQFKSLPFYFTGQISSIYLTLAITVNRYIAVCYPLHVHRICSKKNMYTIAIMILFGGFLFCLPTLIAGVYAIIPIEHKQVYNEDDNWITSILVKYQNVLHNFGHTLVILVIPFSTLIVLNGLIWNGLRKAKKYRAAITHQQLSPTSSPTNQIKQENTVTRMLLTIVIVYIVCYMPFAITQVLYYFFGWYYIAMSNWGSVLLSIYQFMEILNSSVNFVIYLLMGKRFRNSLLEVFGRRKSVVIVSIPLTITTSLT